MPLSMLPVTSISCSRALRQIFKTALTNKVLHDPRQKRLFSQKDLHDLLTLQPDKGKAKTATEIETTKTVAMAIKDEDVLETNGGDNETLKSVLKSKGLAGVFGKFKDAVIGLSSC